MNWQPFATIAAPIIALFVGIWINRWFENRPILISYFGQISTFHSTPPNGASFYVHAHSVILRNAGRRSATTVRLHHSVLPDFNIWPAIVHHVEDVPGGGRDIVIPTMVPGEEITVSYLYFQPLTYAQVNAGIKSDQGFARQIPVLLQQEYPPWFTKMLGLLMLVGIVAVVYVVIRLVRLMPRMWP